MTNSTKSTTASPVYSATFPELIELVGDKEGKPVFLINADGKLKVEGEYQDIDGNKLVPPPTGQLQWLLPRIDEVRKYSKQIEKDGVEKFLLEVIHELVAYFRKYWQAPEPAEAYYLYSALWVIHTYFLEQFVYTPFDLTFGPPERGKSRRGTSMLYASRRGVLLMEPRPQHLFRLAEECGATILLDLDNLEAELNRCGAKNYILYRYERGAQIPRVHNPGKGAFKETTYYEIFGPTLFISNKPVDWLIESRGISLQTTISQKRFAKPTPEDGLPFREKLTAVRTFYMLNGMGLPDVSIPEGGRLADVMTPLYRIAKLVGRDEELLSFFRVQLDERKHARSFTSEAVLLRVCAEYKDKDNVLLSEVTENYNHLADNKWPVSDRAVANFLRNLGLTVKPGHANKSVVYLDRSLHSLLEEYGISAG